MSLVYSYEGQVRIRIGEGKDAYFALGDAEKLLKELPQAVSNARSWLKADAEKRLNQAQADLDKLKG